MRGSRLKNNTDRFYNGADQAAKSLAYQLGFISDNVAKLDVADRSGRSRRTFEDIHARYKAGEKLTPNTVSLVESLYEKTWKGGGYPAASTHIDKKRKGLRFG